MRLKLTKCYVADVLKQIKVERKLEHQPERQMQYTITIDYLAHKYYKNEFSVNAKDIISKTETMFFKEIFREIKKAAKKSGSIVYFEEEKKQSKNDDSKLDEDETADNETPSARRLELGEMHESSDEEEAAEDADATTARRISRHQENREYDDPEEDEIESDDVDNDENKNTVENSKENISDDDGDFIIRTNSVNSLQYEQRKKDVKNMYAHALDYDYDSEKYQWCKLKFWVTIFFFLIER